MSHNRVRLFEMGSLQENECRTFSVPDGELTREIFVVCKQGQYYVYENSCPHTGAPLDWMPDQFLNIDKTLIQCALHQAQFQIHDGYCIYGPCVGQSLKSVSVVEEEGVVWYETEEG